ncbi:CLAVATA3/ESR (CLE)-related protein 12-like [Quillaja saponaria]|uniref:CLAVATA3/ESR (CLE)-related protein 12-like n=1 Tax=Quillaja saponaria TaxID=32244 RepID=A0AAD7PI78_QUISA|nr:CLAVATA3/ESR (CLE)-related protein 12-like [Quillaja saponaria]
MTMIKTHQLFSHILWLSLIFLFFFYGWFSFIPNNYNATTTHLRNNRKVLALATKFDFTPFVRHQRRHQRRHHHQYNHRHPEPAGSDIDPRYDVEKRLVPNGPNPLHH